MWNVQLIKIKLVLFLALLASLSACKLNDNTLKGSIGTNESNSPLLSPQVFVSKPSLIVGASSNTFEFDVTYVNATEVNLTSSDISVDSAGVTCFSVSVVDGRTTSPKVLVTGCTGYGSFSLRINSGTAALNGEWIGEASSSSDSVQITNKAAFVSTWRTTTPDETITLPLRLGFNYKMIVDWGDGSSLSEVTSFDDPDRTHTYSSPGDHVVTIRGFADTLYFNDEGDKEKIISVSELGDLEWKSFEYAFFGCSNLTNVDGGYLSQVTSIKGMFEKAGNAVPDTSAWDTSSIADMSAVFRWANSAQPDTSSWDTSQVTTMGAMFQYYNPGGFSPDTSNWDTSNVTNMGNMFASTTVSPNTSSWDTSKVTNFSGMFYYNAVANPDTSGWDTSAATSMGSMFQNATLANPDTSGWNTSQVTNMSRMFWQAPAASPDTSGWDTSNVTDMHWMFRSATLANPDTSGWNTSKVTKMNYMFGSIDTNPDVSGWDTSQVTDMSYMFRSNATANPNVGGWDTSNVTNMERMFYNADSATPDTSGWNTANVTNMSYMFWGASLANPDVSGWDTSKVIDFRQMFKAANAADPDMSGWSFASVYYVSGMFDSMTLSTARYSDLLIAIDTNPPTNPLALNVGITQYNSGAPAAARANLVGAGWTFTDGGQL